MNKIICIILCLCTTPVWAQRPAQGPMSEQRYTAEGLGYQLIWQDEFNGTRLDSTKWRVRGIGPRALAFVSEKAVKVEDGFVKLYALQQGDSLLGSAIGTQGLLMIKYGFFECLRPGAEIAGRVGGFLDPIPANQPGRRSRAFRR